MLKQITDSYETTKKMLEAEGIENYLFTILN